MAANRQCEVLELIKAAEARLSNVRADLQAISIDTPSDEDVAELLLLRPLLELRLSAGQAELARLEESAGADRRAEREARRNASWAEQENQQRMATAQARILELQQLIED